MRNLFLLLVVILFSTASVSAQKPKKMQKIAAYTATNGITYKLGDEIKLGRGSDTNGDFVYLQYNSLSMQPEDNIVNKNHTGITAKIKKIRKFNMKRLKGIRFVVGIGGLNNATLDIENAIATCEVVDCKKAKLEASTPPKKDKFQKLTELKRLLDSQIITQEEFDTEKKKILAQ